MIAIVLLSVNCKISSGLGLNCTYGIGTYDVIGNIYRCDAKLLFDGQSIDNVTAVYGSHQSGKGYSDVLGLKIENQRMEFVPTNIKAFFPNIKVLMFQNNAISSISNSYLMTFPNLEYLSLHTNKLTSLDSNLLSGLNSMKFVTFSVNSIKHVGHDFVLPNTSRIYFNSNKCISKEATTAAQITELRFSLSVNCPPTISQIENILESRPNLLTKMNGQVQSLVEITNTLEQGHFEMNDEVKNHAYVLAYVNGQVENIVNRTDTLEQSHSEMDSMLKYLQSRNIQLETRVAFLEAAIESRLGIKREAADVDNKN